MKSKTLFTFAWQGKTKQRQLIQGEEEAPHLVALRRKLHDQGIIVLTAKRYSPWHFVRQPIQKNDIILLTEQLAMMMDAGTPLLFSLQMLIASSTKPAMRRLLRSLKTTVESGYSLSQSVQCHPRYFDALFCNLLHVGEQSGTLETMLNHLHQHQLNSFLLKQKIKKALFYPTTVVLLALAVIITMLVVVVPKFQVIFMNFGAALPTLTQAVIDTAHVIQNHGLSLLVSSLLIMVLLDQLRRRSRYANAMLEALALRLPVAGTLLSHARLARFARTLATTTSAGMPLLSGLTLVATIFTGTRCHRAILQSVHHIQSGHALHLALAQSGEFPPLFTQLVQLGETAGTLDLMLGKVATLYETQVSQRVEKLNSLLEPLLMSVVGVMVGGIMMALYLPIFQLGSIL